MIVTELDRLWICKMMLTGFRRIFLFNSHKYLCTNLMVTEKALYFPTHNYYTAVEIGTTRVIWNTTTFMKYQHENAWIHQYFPNWQPLTDGVHPLSNTQSPLQKFFEALLNVFQLNTLNMNLMQTARNFWKRKYKDFDEYKFNSIIQCTPDIVSVWHLDHQSRIQDSFHQRLAVYGIREAA